MSAQIIMQWTLSTMVNQEIRTFDCTEDVMRASNIPARPYLRKKLADVAASQSYLTK